MSLKQECLTEQTMYMKGNREAGGEKIKKLRAGCYGKEKNYMFSIGNNIFGCMQHIAEK